MENKNENIDVNEDDSIDDNHSFDIDKENLTLIDVNKKLSEKRSKQEQNSLFLKLKRKKPEKNIIEYDLSSNSILNKFCPSKKEMDEFLQKCKIKEITLDELKNTKFTGEKIFNPKMYMKINQMNQLFLSFEELQLNTQDNEDLNESCKKSISLINPGISNIYKSEKKVQSVIPNEPKKTLRNILKSDILSKAQKDWLNDHIKEILNMKDDSVLKRNKKLEVIFDLDNTLIFSFINEKNQKLFDYCAEKYQRNELNYFSCEFEDKIVFSAFIIRQGVKEFIEYAKNFCNFNINTLSTENYANSVIKILEKEYKIKFINKVMRTEENKNNKREKKITEFKCNRINYENAIIFDDNVGKWENDSANVIPSKFFFDKNVGEKLIEDNLNSNNNITCILNSHQYYFHYFFMEKNSSNPKWKDQQFIKKKPCPFYHFKEKDKKYFFDIYNSEYFDSNKKQFIYMKNVIKVIYYMVYHDNISIYEILMLIRLNIFYKKYFYLKYINKKNIEMLSEVIRICGGEIIEPDESIEFVMKKKIFLVCSFDVYEKQRNFILEEAKDKYLLVNDKFILDSFYFITDLGDEYNNSEYNPEICYQKAKTFLVSN